MDKSPRSPMKQQRVGEATPRTPRTPKMMQKQKSLEIEAANNFIESLFPWIYWFLVVMNVVIECYHLHSLRYTVKPLTVIVLILYFINKTHKDKSSLVTVVGFALLFSLFGDIALMFVDETNKDDNYFLLGIFFFAVAHLFYIISHLLTLNESPEFIDKATYGLLALPFFGYAAVVVAYLFSGLGPFAAPVAIYALIFATNGGLAAMRFNHTVETGYWCLLVGVIAFMLSDTLIALMKFGGWKQEWVDPAVIFTYLLGQYCIVQGVTLHVRQVHYKKLN
jgi:uncharacterized membrane protein YhhN